MSGAIYVGCYIMELHLPVLSVDQYKFANGIPVPILTVTWNFPFPVMHGAHALLQCSCWFLPAGSEADWVHLHWTVELSWRSLENMMEERSMFENAHFSFYLDMLLLFTKIKLSSIYDENINKLYKIYYDWCTKKTKCAKLLKGKETDEM